MLLLCSGIGAIMRRMTIHQRLSEIEAEVKAAGNSVADLLQIAGIHITTWNRWKRGAVGPTMTNWAKVEDARAKLMRAA